MFFLLVWKWIFLFFFFFLILEFRSEKFTNPNSPLRHVSEFSCCFITNWDTRKKGDETDQAFWTLDPNNNGMTNFIYSCFDHPFPILDVFLHFLFILTISFSSSVHSYVDSYWLCFWGCFSSGSTLMKSLCWCKQSNQGFVHHQLLIFYYIYIYISFSFTTTYQLCTTKFELMRNTFETHIVGVCIVCFFPSVQQILSVWRHRLWPLISAWDMFYCFASFSSRQ